MTRPRTIKPLASIGPFDLQEKVGSGGMGSVYRARDRRDGRVVALKLMHEHVASDASYAERFRREAAVAALIDSPNVVRVLEFASDGGRPYIVTEFIEGPGVDELLREGAIPAPRAAAIAVGVANALAAASRSGVVHRDIKPGNILIAPDGTPKVTDFGIATLHDSGALTLPGIFIGTAAYAAPEQHRGESDSRSDMYSLGVVLFEMLSGSLPFSAETATGMMRKHEEAPVPIERLAGQPAALVDIAARCLEKSPAGRFQHPGELSAVLAAAARPGSAPGETVVVAAPAVLAATSIAPAVPAGPDDPSATRLEREAWPTGEQPYSPALAGWQARAREAAVLRKAGVAAVVVACVTALAMFGFRGSSAEDPPASSGGGGGGQGAIGVVTQTPGRSASPSPSPSPSPAGKLPPSPTATPSPTFPPTETPPPARTPTATPKAPLPPPAPALAIADYTFCHVAGCPYGSEDLWSGYTIAVVFKLSQPTTLPISAEIWFDGEYYYTSDFTASSSGMYYDLLPYANYEGELEVDVYAGGAYVGTLFAEVW